MTLLSETDRAVQRRDRRLAALFERLAGCDRELRRWLDPYRRPDETRGQTLVRLLEATAPRGREPDEPA
jgi:hypothetical protein